MGLVSAYPHHSSNWLRRRMEEIRQGYALGVESLNFHHELRRAGITSLADIFSDAAFRARNEDIAGKIEEFDRTCSPLGAFALEYLPLFVYIAELWSEMRYNLDLMFCGGVR